MNFENNESKAEKIVAAAIEIGDEIFTGVNHADAIVRVEDKYPHWDTDKSLIIGEGFLTSKGRFVSREEAGQIAKGAAQLGHLPEEEQVEAGEKLDSGDIFGDTGSK
jgi:hypothetical protein